MTRTVACSFGVQVPDTCTDADLFGALHQAVALLGGRMENGATFTEPGRENDPAIFMRSPDDPGAATTDPQ